MADMLAWPLGKLKPGKCRIDSLDEAAHTASMHASGTDKRGQGGAKATIRSTLAERDGGGTHVAVETDFTITGRLARFGRGGMIQDVSNRLLRDFADCLRSGLEQPVAAAEDGPPEDAAPAPTKPISGIRLLLGALLDRLRRLLRRS